MYSVMCNNANFLNLSLKYPLFVYVDAILSMHLRNVLSLRMSGGLNTLSFLEDMSSMNYVCICIYNHSILFTGRHNSSIKRMFSQLLVTIKEKFSEVLIPPDRIKKQDLLGRGMGELEQCPSTCIHKCLIVAN